MFTLCIPTKNRPEFVERQLRYYARTGWRHAIFVGDASDSEPAQRTRQVCERFQRSLRVRYVDHSGLNVMACLEALGRAAESRYCGWVSDDDFLCTRGVEACLEFLEGHPDYAAAQGVGLIFQTDGSRPYAPMGNVAGYDRIILEEERAVERLRKHVAAGMPSLHTAVRRTEAFVEMVGGFGHLRGARQGFIFDDLFPHWVGAIQGKAKGLDGLYIVRHAHDGIYRQMNAFDWMTDPMWQPTYRAFRDRVAEMLVREDGLSQAQAETVFKEIAWPYLAEALSSSWRNHQIRSAPQRSSPVRSWIRSMPVARTAARRLRAVVQRYREPLSLAALLRPSSPYHADFVEIWRVVTGSGTMPAEEPALHAAEAVS